MKRGFVIGIILSVAVLVWLYIDSQPTQTKRTLAQQQMHFRYPQKTALELASLISRQNSPSSPLPPTFLPDLDLAVKAEFETWRKQFEKGESDRQLRLSWQQQTEASLKQSMRRDLKTEAWLEQQILEKTPAISEAAGQAWFSDHAEEMRVPKRYRVSHIFLSGHDPKQPNRAAEIQALYDQLNRGQVSFADLAAKYSEDIRTKDRGGDLGWISAARMPADFMRGVEKAAIGEITQPIETKLGWHLVRVLARQESRLPNFDEVREEITAMLDQQRRETALDAGN